MLDLERVGGSMIEELTEGKPIWKPRPVPQCPGCYLTPAECSPDEPPPLETVPGYVQCPRCEGGCLEELDEESTEEELRRAIRECQKGRKNNKKGSSSGSKGRKKDAGYSGGSRAEQDAMVFLGRAPEREVLARRHLGTVTVDARLSVRASYYLESATLRLGVPATQVLKAFALWAIHDRKKVIDTQLSAKDKKVDIKQFTLGEQEAIYLQAMARGYGIGVGTLMFFIIEEQRRSYENK